MHVQISNPTPAPAPDQFTTPTTSSDAENGPSTSYGPSGSSGRPYKLVPDGQKLHVQGELLILAVGNGRQAGGGMLLCPHAGNRNSVEL